MENRKIDSGKNYCGTIDLLRFVACLIVVCHHSYMLTVPNTVPCAYHGGWIFTDFFFMLTGLFMIEKLHPQPLAGGGILLADARFLFSKVKRIYPYFITAFLLEFFVKEILSKATLLEMVNTFFGSIWTILLVYMLGFRDCGFMGITWYISSMLIALFLIFPLAYKNKRIFLNLIAPIIVLVSYVYMDMHTGGTGLGTGAVREWLGVAYFGTIRAIGGIALGAMIWSAANELNAQKKITQGMRALLTVVEAAGYLYVILKSFNDVTGKVTYLYLAILACALALTKSGITYSGCFPQKLCKYLGRLSLSVYLCQLTAIFVIYYIAFHMQIIPAVYEKMLPWYMFLALVLGMAVDFSVTKLLKIGEKKEIKNG